MQSKVAYSAVGAVASIGLLVSLLTTPLASAETTAPDLPTLEPPTVLMGALGKPPALSVAAQSVAPGRPGGYGRFEVVFASTTRSTAPIRDLEVRVAAPTGTTLSKVTGDRWRCRLDGERRAAVCAMRGDISWDEDPPGITGVFRIPSTFTSNTARIWTWARWAGAARDVGQWVVSDQGTVAVYPKVTLDVASSSDTINVFSNGPRQARQIMLGATIGNLEGQYASLAWRQISGPPVIFMLPQTVDGVSAEAQQIVEVTSFAKRQRYEFAARVVAQGQVVERRVRLVVVGDRLLEELDSATPTEAAIAAATSLPRLGGSLTIESRRDFRIDGPLTAPAGSQVILRVAGSDARRGTVSWTVGARSIGAGRTVQVTSPNQVGASSLVTARVTLPSGVVIRAEHVVMATAPKVTARVSFMPRNRTGFCRVVTSIRDGQAREGSRTLEVPMGTQGVQRLTLRYDRATIDATTLDEQGACTGQGGIDITGAVLIQSTRVRLANVTAHLTPDGLVVSRARATVNSSLSNPLTDLIGLDITGDLSATWAGGSLGVLVGSATFTPVGDPAVNPAELLLSLPEGWEYPVDGSQISFDGDLGVRLAQAVLSPLNAQGTRVTLAVGVDIIDRDPTSVDVTVANLVLGETPRGGLLSASGSGRITLPETDDDTDIDYEVRLPIICDSGWESRTCEMFGGLRFGRASLVWSREKISLDVDAAMSVGESRAYGVTFSGSYRASDDWDLAISDSAPWDLGDGLRLRALRGSITSRPGDGETRLTMSITGTLEGLSLGKAITVKKLTPTLTNACPADGNPTSCSLDEIKLFLDAEIAALLPGSDEPTTFKARADVNLTTLDFVFTSGASDMQVGPEELRLTDVQLIISRGAQASCVPIDAPATADDTAVTDDTGITVQFSGTARILTKNYTLNVQSDDRGLCIWGSGDTIDIGGGFTAVSPRVAFTTFPDGAKIDGIDTIEPRRLIMRGGFLFPNNVAERFQIPGRGVTFEADISSDLKEARFAIAYNADNEVTLYKGQGAELTVGQLALGLDVRLAGDSPGFDGYFFGTGRLDMEGSDAVAASSTPLEVRIGVGYAVGESLRLELQAGVPSGSVENAFGVSGLTVRRLSAGAAIDLISGAPSVAINADVTLPEGWGEAVGLLPGTSVALAVNLDLARPCLEFRVGSNGGDPVIDLGGQGFITGNYFRLVLAPTGCEIPDGRRTQRISAGWAFTVQGTLMGSAFEATSSLQIDSDGIRIDAVLQLPQLDLFGVVGFRSHAGLGGPKITLEVDTGRDVFDVGLDGAIEIGDVSSKFGILVSVRGDIKKASDRFSIDLAGRAQTKLGPVDISLDPLTVKGSIPMPGKESATNQLFIDISTGVALTLDLDALGTYTVKGSGRLSMQDFTVTQLSMKAGGAFDAVVYKVEGDISVDLCMGTLSEIKADGTGSTCTLFAQKSLATSSPALRVGVTGTEYRPFADPKPFARVFYDREAVERT